MVQRNHYRSIGQMITFTTQADREGGASVVGSTTAAADLGKMQLPTPTEPGYHSSVWINLYFSGVAGLVSDCLQQVLEMWLFLVVVNCDRRPHPDVAR
jgi:hypothetical protein